jgi:hypothetical protein
MISARSFAEFVKAKCFDGLCKAVENYANENWCLLGLYSHRVQNIEQAVFSDATIERVYVSDLPGTRVSFDVGVEVEMEVSEANRHNDYSDECYPWVRVSCEGDLSCGLDDWKIKSIEPYDKKKAPMNSLSDALVPYIPYDRLESVATAFLKEHYPEALRIPRPKQAPIYVDPSVLADRLGLTIKTQRIKEDASVFGQIFFAETDTEMFDVRTGTAMPVHVDERTIVVDPTMYLLRNYGSVNNTIVHECVHWVKHRKVFELEKLYNDQASSITCEVVGGAKANVDQSATEQMERQANQLTPRIQMPAEPFKAKAKEYIIKFMRETNARHENEVMEKVIVALETDFGVSKQAAKIRLVELGFDEAIGTFTYLDGHYVKPHGFRKGILKVNQTFSLNAQDAAIQRLVNPELRQLTESGDYLFVDNHYVYNAPLYVGKDENGRLDLTDYARSHMDECCLVFDMTITSKVGEDYHTACFLNREPNDITFEIKFHNGYQNAPQERQVAMRKKVQAEELEIRKQMTDDSEQCMKLLLDWRGMNYTDLGLEIDRDPKTISRTVKGETAPTVETAALICFGLHLPPTISFKLIEVLGCKLNPMKYPNHQWINEALYIKYPEPIWAIREYLAPYGVEI